MDRWPQIRGAIRDLAAIALGVYIGVRASEPPINVEDIPAFTLAAGFIGVPFVFRSEE